MNKILIFIFFLILTNGCSFNKNSKFWTASENIVEESNKNYEEIFVEEKVLEKEFNPNLKINLKDSVSPVLIEDNSDKNSYYVIMPMKI